MRTHGFFRAIRIVPAALLLTVVLTPECRALDLGKWLRRGKKAVETARRIHKAMEATQLSPEQEHYIGRAVAARILSEHRPYENAAANRYVNLLGQTLAQVSDRPETYKGYRFLILDTDEINSFAAPGGFIFVTRGLIRCCRTEDGLAAVLAHEIAHVQYKHGLRSIRSKRLTAVGMVLLGEVSAESGSKDFRELVNAFEGSIDDIADNLIQSKYSRATEVVADRTAVTILQRLGYDPAAFAEVLREMERRFETDRRGFFKTHPDPAYRLRVIREAAGEDLDRPPVPPAARQERFAAFRKGV